MRQLGLVTLLLCGPAFAQGYLSGGGGIQSNCPSCNLVDSTLTLSGSAVVGNGSANLITIAGVAAGSSPTITVSGSDTNIGLALVPKGTGAVVPGADASVNLGSASIRWSVGHFLNVQTNSIGNDANVDNLQMNGGFNYYLSHVADGASAIAHRFDTKNALVTSGAEIADFESGGSVRAWVDLNGGIRTASTSAPQFQCTGAASCFLQGPSGQAVIVDTGGGAAAVQVGSANATSVAIGNGTHVTQISGYTWLGTGTNGPSATYPISLSQPAISTAANGTVAIAVTNNLDSDLSIIPSASNKFRVTSTAAGRWWCAGSDNQTDVACFKGGHELVGTTTDNGSDTLQVTGTAIVSSTAKFGGSGVAVMPAKYTCAMSAGTSCTATVVSGMTCNCSDATAGHTTACGVSVSTTTATVTAAASNSDTWVLHCE